MIVTRTHRAAREVRGYNCGVHIAVAAEVAVPDELIAGTRIRALCAYRATGNRVSRCLRNAEATCDERA